MELLSGCRSIAGLSIHFIATRLLQLTMSPLPTSTIQPLQCVVNAALRVIMNLSLHDHMKPALKKLHWLPVEQRITHKPCLSMRHIHIGLAPKYVSDCIGISIVSAASSRYRLRSTGSEFYVLPRTRTRFGDGVFFYSSPAAWNTLLSDLHDITVTCRCTFRKRLRSALFDKAYHRLLLALVDVSYSGALQISR